MRALRSGRSSLALTNPAPVSDSWAEDMTASRIFDRTKIGAFIVGSGSDGLIGRIGASLRKKYPPSRERALVSDKYDASECAHRCILDALYSSMGLGCVAA